MQFNTDLLNTYRLDQTGVLTASFTTTQGSTASLVVSHAFLKILTAVQAQVATNIHPFGAALLRTFTATQSQTAAIARSIGAVRSATQGNTATIKRAVGKAMSITQAQAVLAVKTVSTYVVPTVQGSAATLSRAFGHVWLATVTPVASGANLILRWGISKITTYLDYQNRTTRVPPEE